MHFLYFVCLNDYKSINHKSISTHLSKPGSFLAILASTYGPGPYGAGPLGPYGPEPFII